MSIDIVECCKLKLVIWFKIIQCQNLFDVNLGLKCKFTLKTFPWKTQARPFQMQFDLNPVLTLGFCCSSPRSAAPLYGVTCFLTNHLCKACARLKCLFSNSWSVTLMFATYHYTCKYTTINRLVHLYVPLNCFGPPTTSNLPGFFAWVFRQWPSSSLSSVPSSARSLDDALLLFNQSL